MNDEMLDSVKRIEEKLHAIKDLRGQMAEMGDRMTEIEQKGSYRPGDGGSANGAGSTLGDQVFESIQKHGDTLARTKSLRIEGLTFKAAADAVTTTSGRNIVTGRVGAPSGPILGLHVAFPTRTAAGVTALEYSRYTGTQGAAAVQATEGSPKAAVRPDHAIVAQTAVTIAGFTKMSRQAVNDRAELVQAVDVTLRRSVYSALDTVLADGSVTPAFTGLIPLATATTSATYTVLVDAISEAVATMQIAGFTPDVVAVSPATWLGIVTLRAAADGAYLTEAYLGEVPMTLRGLRVVLSAEITAGKALLLDSSHLELIIVDGWNVELGYTGSDFTNNIVTLLGEMRVLPVFRAVGAAMLITAKAA